MHHDGGLDSGSGRPIFSRVAVSAAAKPGDIPSGFLAMAAHISAAVLPRVSSLAFSFHHSRNWSNSTVLSSSSPSLISMRVAATFFGSTIVHWPSCFRSSPIILSSSLPRLRLSKLLKSFRTAFSSSSSRSGMIKSSRISSATVLHLSSSLRV